MSGDVEKGRAMFNARHVPPPAGEEVFTVEQLKSPFQRGRAMAAAKAGNKSARALLGDAVGGDAA